MYKRIKADMWSISQLYCMEVYDLFTFYQFMEIQKNAKNK